jgi:hypothetical protein
MKVLVFCRFRVEYRQSNHDIVSVVRINRFPVAEKQQIGYQARQQPKFGDIFFYGEQWNVRDLILLILCFFTGKITRATYVR